MPSSEKIALALAEHEPLDFLLPDASSPMSPSVGRFKQQPPKAHLRESESDADQWINAASGKPAGRIVSACDLAGSRSLRERCRRIFHSFCLCSVNAPARAKQITESCYMALARCSEGLLTFPSFTCYKINPPSIICLCTLHISDS